MPVKENPLFQFDQLPDSAHVRVPTVAALWAIATSTVWRKVKTGEIPPPKRIGPQSTAWNVGELRTALASLNVVDQ